MKCVLACTLVAAVSLASCMFQNDPLAPNQPPSIRSYTPDITFFTLVAPDSCTFSIEASDPDGDELKYYWLLGDSLLGTKKIVTFYAVRAGEYGIHAEARDGSRRASHDWHVTVISKINTPPIIEWYYPEQAQIACAVGDTLEFHLRAEDDDPSRLQYIYRLNGTVLHSGSPDFLNRFMDRGEFVLEGIAWDGQYGDTISWDVNVTGFPDTLAPGAITDLTGGPGELDGSIWLEWTAPGDDGYEGRSSSYIVRTSTYPIVTEDDWREAEGKIGEPVPSVAGTTEHMVIRNLVSASYVYVTMRAVDDFFNLSPIGNCVKVAIRGIDIGGRVLDAATGAWLGGIVVSAGIRSDVSAPDGTYFLQNVPSYTTIITVRDEYFEDQIGAYYDIVKPIGSITQFIHLDLPMIGVFGLVNTVPPDQYEGRFLSFFKDITHTSGDYGQPTVYKGWNHWPLTVYNPAFSFAGIDLQAATSAALADWNSAAGVGLFTEVDSEAGADVVVRYDTTNDYRHNVKTQYNPDGTPNLREIWMYTLNAEVPLQIYSHLVLMHELGHVIGLFHSRNAGHLMVGLTTPRVEYPTTDELNVVKCLYRFPHIFDYSCVIEE